METEYKNCVDSEKAYRYLFEHGEMSLHLPENFETWTEFNIKKDEHSDKYITDRIVLVKYLYCKLAKSDILRAYSRDKVRTIDGKVTPEEEKEARRIVKEAERLLNETRDIDEYHHEGTHWWDNRMILSGYITYLSAVYDFPVSIMTTTPKKSFWDSLNFFRK